MVAAAAAAASPAGTAAPVAVAELLVGQEA
jgi:hypothetical protein